VILGDTDGVVDAIEALIPPFVMATLFVILLITAFRATDGAKRRADEDEAGSRESAE
jgi:hypothetical protein